MVDPYEALVSFQAAFAAGELRTQPGRVHEDLIVHADRAGGFPRLTYVMGKGEYVQALVEFIVAEPIAGIACFAVGYAVDEKCRRRGLAGALLAKAIDEMRLGMRAHMPAFYLEAVVDQSNIASNRLARRSLSDAPITCVDEASGEPAYAYQRLISTR